MQSPSEARLVALFASLNVLQAYDVLAHEDREAWRVLTESISAVRNERNASSSLAIAYYCFSERRLALDYLLSLVESRKEVDPKDSPIKRARLACEIAELSTVPERDFDLNIVLAKRTLLKQALGVAG